METPTSLTQGEKAVLSLVREGMRNGAIADVLCVSIRTVEHYIYRACQKLGVRKRKEACTIATEMGLLPEGITPPHPAYKNGSRIQEVS